MIDFEKFEKQCDEIREINAKYIEEFVDELSKKGFVDKTIKRHYEMIIARGRGLVNGVDKSLAGAWDGGGFLWILFHT